MGLDSALVITDDLDQNCCFLAQPRERRVLDVNTPIRIADSVRQRHPHEEGEARFEEILK